MTEYSNSKYQDGYDIVNLAYNLFQTLKNIDLNDLKEPLFNSQIVEKVILPFLCIDGSNVLLKGSTDESIRSKQRRNGYGRIPDLSIEVGLNGTTALLFVCEIKSSKNMNNLPPNECRSPDFIKICNIMKDELDRMRTTFKKMLFFVYLWKVDMQAYSLWTWYIIKRTDF